MRQIAHRRFIIFLFTSLALVGTAAVFALVHFGADADPYIGYGVLALSVSGILFAYNFIREWGDKPLRRLYRVPTSIWAGLLVGVAIVGFYFTGPALYQRYLMATKPYLTWTGEQDPSSAITVCWVTSFPEDSIVRYGLSPLILDKTVTISGGTRYHHVPITSLLANTTYYYVAGNSALKQFTTAPTGAFNFSFYVWSDPRENNEMMRAQFRPNTPLEMWEDAVQDDIDVAFSICTGDITSGSQDYETWNLWFEDITTNDWATNRSHTMAFGNHERHGDAEGNTLQQFYPQKKQSDGRFWYSFNYGEVHFLMLDPYEEGASWMANFTDEHLAWLEADLAANADQKYKIGFMHPPALNGAGIETDLKRLANDYNISLFLSGHEHYYNHQEFDDVHYIIEGIGGNANNNYQNYATSTGFIRISVSSTEMRVESRWINGTTIEQFTILPPP